MKQTVVQPSLNDIITFAKDLIAIHSTEDNPRALLEILTLAAEKLPGYTTQKFTSNGKPSLLIHNDKPTTKHFTIILNAHLDVIPGKDEQFIPFIKNGKLIGRGAYDMKAGAAVMILLFKEIANNINYPLALQLVTDEEVSGLHGTKYQIAKGITADFVIAGENTDNNIINKAKGPLWLKIKTTGKTAHGAYLWKGDNALWKMHTVLTAIKQQFPVPTHPAWETTVNLAKIETSNSTFNKVPDACVAWLDIRVIPEEEKTIMDKLKKVLPEDMEIEIVVHEPPADTDASNPFVTQLQSAVKRINNKRGEITATNGASDVRFYNKIQIPGVEFGPIGGGAHSDEEWVSVLSFPQSVIRVVTEADLL